MEGRIYLSHDGRFFLYYKAMKQGDVMRMGLAVADKLEGPYVFQKDYLCVAFGVNVTGGSTSCSCVLRIKEM